MNYDTIFALILFSLSFFGIIIIVFRRVSVLASLPDIGIESSLKTSYWSVIKNKIKDFFISFLDAKQFSLEIFLQKILSKLRIFIIKIENKIFSWTQVLKKKTEIKKSKEKDSYWDEIKKLIKK